MDKVNLEELKNCLIKTAEQETWEDDSDDEDLDINGFSGGQTDDAYYGGTTTGETMLARYVLKEYFGLDVKAK